MAGGSRNTRSTQNNREEPSEDEELTDEVYEGVTAYLAADKRLAAERNISKCIQTVYGFYGLRFISCIHWLVACLPLGTYWSRYRAAFLFTCIGSCSLTGFFFSADSSLLHFRFFLTMYSRPLGWCVVQTPNWPRWTMGLRTLSLE